MTKKQVMGVLENQFKLLEPRLDYMMEKVTTIQKRKAS